MVKQSIKLKTIPRLKTRLSSNSSCRILKLFKTSSSNRRTNKYLIQTPVWHLKMVNKWISTTYNFNNKCKNNNKTNKTTNCKISSNSSNSSLSSKIKFTNRVNKIFRLFKEIKSTKTRNNEDIIIKF